MFRQTNTVHTSRIYLPFRYYSSRRAAMHLEILRRTRCDVRWRVPEHGTAACRVSVYTKLGWDQSALRTRIETIMTVVQLSVASLLAL